MSDGLLHLILGGISVPRQCALGFPNRDFHCRNAVLRACQQNDPADLSKGNTRFGILLEGKNVLNDHQVGLFGIQNRTEFRKDVVKPAGQSVGF